MRISGLQNASVQFGRSASEEERQHIQGLLQQHMPDVADRFEHMDVRVVRSNKEAVLENILLSSKMRWAALRSQTYQVIGWFPFARAEKVKPGEKQLPRSIGGPCETKTVMTDEGSLTYVRATKK